LGSCFSALGSVDAIAKNERLMKKKEREEGKETGK
jgi:hypothetical protein